MAGLNRTTSALALAVALFGSLAAPVAMAVPQSGAPSISGQVDPSQVQSLTSQLEAALDALGCPATTADDIAALQATIAKSGYSPSVAQAALQLVIVWPKLCGNEGLAVASVDQTIALALNGSGSPAAGTPGGPGGGAPIGAPPTFVSGGGTDYVVVPGP